MPRKGEIRTVLGLRIRDSRLSVEEFAQRLEEFARKNKEVGTLSLRHVHRLVAGKLETQQLRPATVRLLEGFLGCSVEELFSSADKSTQSLPVEVDTVGEQPYKVRSSSALAVVRKRLGYSQESFAETVGVDVTTVGRWERGAQAPQPWMRSKVAKALKITVEEVAELIEPSGAPAVGGIGIPVYWSDVSFADSGSSTPGGDSDMPVNRRSFLSIAAVAAVDVGVAQDLTVSIAGGDAGPLTTVQTTYDVDKAIASMLDRATRSTLLRWTEDLSNPVARVNATGILAKMPDQGESNRVVSILRNDDEVQRLYLTAVTTRVCAIKWEHAAKFIESSTDFPFASIAVERFAREVVNPADVGAWWCSAKMLQELSPVVGR